MKYEILSLYTSIIIVLLTQVRADGISYEREGKFLKFNGISNLGKLNFDRVLSQWNKSDSENDRRKIQEPEVRTEIVETVQEETHTSDVYTLMEKFSSAFKKCIFSHKKSIIQNPYDGKNIIFKCFRVELIKELQTVVRDVDSVSLLNGYVELEKNDKSIKKIKKPLNGKGNEKGNVYSQYYKNIFDEMLAGEPKTKQSKTETEGNEDSVISGYGKYVIKEIAENLEREEEQVRSFKDSFMDNDLVSVLGDISKKFTLRFNLFPGVSARMRRSQSTGVTFDLELDDLTGFGYDDDDSDKKKKKKKGLVKGNKDDSSSEEDDDEEEEEEDEEDDAAEKAEGDEEDDEEEDEGDKKGKGKGKGKGKQKNKMKKKFKMIKKLIPYLLIPLMIQAVLLPLAFKFLLFFAIKALLAGKIALLLVAINLLKSTNFKSDEDEYVERVGQDHYGYDKGVEYGAWVNRRAFDVEEEQPSTEAVDNHPYRGYAPKDE